MGRIVYNHFGKINDYLVKRSSDAVSNYSDEFIINVENSSQLTVDGIRRLKQIGSSRIKIRVAGAYDSERIKNYPNHEKFHTNDNIYTLNELEQIIKILEQIESNINPNWSEEQKLVYFIGILKNKIIYHPFYETVESKEIRSLRGLLSRKTVCAGYAMILKELCDRNGVECQYVEGTCNEADYQKGYLTHAWNIVKIKGDYVPLDLTWNAGRDFSGNTRSIEDIGNVNEFVKTHIPGRYEKIQDYKNTLKSIDGTYLMSIYNLVNKDVVYDLRTYNWQRNNYLDFKITQVEEMVVDDQNVYKYIYNVIRRDGSLGPTKIVYSSSNIAGYMSLIERREKLKKQLVEAIRKNDNQKVAELNRKLKGSEYLDNICDAIRNRMFSTANLKAAEERGDYYVGKIKVDTDPDGKSYIDAVLINPSLGKQIKNRQKTYKRSDGTTFVLETYGKNNIDGYEVYRYRMFENINVNGHNYVRKNTIFTDVDVFTDDRQSLADDFFARDRVDRKRKESNGYLGYYSKDGVRIYHSHLNKVFTEKIYQQLELDKKKVKNYYEKLTFKEMKKMFEIYEYEYDFDTSVSKVVNKNTGEELKDPDILLRFQFASVWLKAAGIKQYYGELVPGYNYAYKSDKAEEIFYLISHLIQQSINKSGNIDPVAILDTVKKKHDKYKYTEEIVVNLFRTDGNFEIIEKIFRLQNPSAMNPTNEAKPLYNVYLSMEALGLRRQELEEQKKQLLEVIEENNREVVVPYNR